MPATAIKITLESPALKVMTDFDEHEPLLIEASMKALDAERMMQKTHVRLKLVIDHHDEFLGVISLSDLYAEEIMKQVAQGYPREDIEVRDLMRNKMDLDAIELSHLTDISIAKLIQKLANFEEQHILILENQGQQLRGIVSASDIARKLKLPINLTERVTFSRIFKYLKETGQLHPLSVASNQHEIKPAA
jgi:CBS domain containing-hemolysin-like protein